MTWAKVTDNGSVRAPSEGSYDEPVTYDDASQGSDWKSWPGEGLAISDVVRCMIDAAYEDILRTRREQAVERLIGLNLEDPPDPETVSRELEAAHEPGGLY